MLNTPRHKDSRTKSEDPANFCIKAMFHSVYFTLNNCANSRSKVWDALFARVNLRYQAVFWRLRKERLTHGYSWVNSSFVCVQTPSSGPNYSRQRMSFIRFFFVLMQIEVNVNKRNINPMIYQCNLQTRILSCCNLSFFPNPPYYFSLNPSRDSACSGLDLWDGNIHNMKMRFILKVVI